MRTLNSILPVAYFSSLECQSSSSSPSALSLVFLFLFASPGSSSLTLTVILQLLGFQDSSCERCSPFPSQGPDSERCPCQVGGCRKMGNLSTPFSENQSKAAAALNCQNTLPTPNPRAVPPAAPHSAPQFMFPFECMLSRSVTENHLHWQLQKY